MGNIGMQLPDRLTEAMWEHVKKVKEFRSYSMTELVREAVQKFLREVKENGRID